MNQKSEPQDLTPIPIPPEQRWREFRIAYLPLITFLSLVAVIAWMWKDYVRPSEIIGEVETLRADVISPVAGTVLELRVDHLQFVTNGQEIGVVRALEPDQVAAELTAAETELLIMKSRMDLDRARNMDSMARLKTDMLTAQLDLELARIGLVQAEAELDRSRRLMDEQILQAGVGSDGVGFEVALRDRNALTAEILARQKTVSELESAWKLLSDSGTANISSNDGVIERAIAAQRSLIESMQQPQTLRAPMTGFISDIRRRPGERVLESEAIVRISTVQSDRIHAWVQQPILHRPKVGDTVEVRRMGLGSPTFEAKVIQVGAQLEAVSPLLRSPTANPERIEIGLPLLVQSEAIRQLIPGEPVQLRVLR